MKRIVSVVFAAGAALALSANSAQAQNLSFGVGGGLTIPNGDFGDVAKTGWHGLVNIGYAMPSGIGLRGDVFYGQHSLDSDLLDGKFKLSGVLGNVTYTFKTAGGVKPYLIGSVGGFNAKFEADGLGDSDETKVAFGGGAGVKFRAGTDSNIFVEGRYISVSTSDNSTTFIPITVGISFGL